MVDKTRKLYYMRKSSGVIYFIAAAQRSYVFNGDKNFQMLAGCVAIVSGGHYGDAGDMSL